MQVTRIEEINKSRSRVYLEQEFAFVLYKGELRRYRIKEGEDLSEKDYEAIMTEVLPKRAKLRAMNLLQKREYTTAQLRTKLKLGGYPEAILEEALEYVASFHYTDDLRYASNYIRCNENLRSRKRIEQDLLGKGIPKEMICEAWTEWEKLGGAQNEEEMIRRLLTKRGYDASAADYVRRQKEAAYLLRKGFSAECIRQVLRDWETLPDF